MNTVVYQWLGRDGAPYYVGIGNPRRPYTGKRRCGPPPPRDRIVILHEGLDWGEACKTERELIAFYGRRDLGTGILLNFSNGGEGNPNPSEETREKISAASRGRKASKETREKLSAAHTGKNHHCYTPRDWYHPVHGTILQKSVPELVKMFPEENLTPGNLRLVALVRRPHHKKWTMIETSEGGERPKEVRKGGVGRGHRCYTPRDWYHPVHGTILQKSISELREMFPEENLDSSCLSQVALVRRPHHKKWTMIETSEGGERPKEVMERGFGRNHFRYTPRDWYHPLHGKILQKSISELREMFPEENLDSSCLSRVALGKLSHHKQWSRVESNRECK